MLDLRCDGRDSERTVDLWHGRGVGGKVKKREKKKKRYH